LKKKNEKYKDYSDKVNQNINEIRKELYGENPNYKNENGNYSINENISAQNEINNNNNINSNINNEIKSNPEKQINNYNNSAPIKKENHKSYSVKESQKEGKINFKN